MGSPARAGIDRIRFDRSGFCRWFPRTRGEDRASYLITVISEAYLVPVSAFLSKPSTALIL